MFYRYLVILALALFPLRIFGDSLDYQINFQTNKFRTILEKISKNHFDSVDIVKTSDKAFEALMKSLDNQSVYYPAPELKRIQESNRGVSYGIGIEIFKFGDTLVVGSVSDNSPALKSGLQLGDKIIFIDNKNSKDISQIEAQNKISGDTNTYVNLIIKRDETSDLKEFKIIRKSIEIPSISLHFLVDKTDIGYISINRFSEITDIEFNKAIKSLISQGMKKVILDLRGNPGGLLNKASNIADQFIKGGKPIVYTESRNPEHIVKEISKFGDVLEDFPVIILVDEKSASGSEIIAGAIQDYDLGLVVGENTFGKGSIQQLWNFGDGSAIRITLGYYHTPTGRILQKGLTKSDEQVVLDPSAELQLDSTSKSKLLDAINKVGGQKNLPTFKTSKGRTVFGGGGIFPDYQIKNDTTTIMTNLLKRNGVFVEWAFKYLNAKRDSLFRVYLCSEDFINHFKLTDAMLQDFAKYALNLNLWNSNMFEIDKKYICNYLRAILSYALFGNNPFYRIQLNMDKPLQAAIQLMPQAEKLLSINNKKE